MKDFNPNNPFIVGKYISDSYFCDREKETEFLGFRVPVNVNVPVAG